MLNWSIVGLIHAYHLDLFESKAVIEGNRSRTRMATRQEGEEEVRKTGKLCRTTARENFLSRV